MLIARPSWPGANDYQKLAAEARKELDAGKSDSEVREIKQQYIEAQDGNHRRKAK